MQSRMDKYNVIDKSDKSYSSRTRKNQDLYEKIKTTDVKSLDLSSNMKVLDDNIKSINLNKVHDLLDDKYETPRRRTIQIDEISSPTQELDPIQDTREYDINAVLEQAKQGKSIDYNKERLKKVRETQYEILNNIDLNNKKTAVELAQQDRKEQEENLKTLINTITKIEKQNKNKTTYDTSKDLDLLSDLMGDDEDDKITSVDIEKIGGKFNSLDTIDITSEIGDGLDTTKVPEVTETKPDIVIGGVQEEEPTLSITKDVKKEEPKIEIPEIKIDEPEKKDEEKPAIADTLSKLDIDLSSYDDFGDIDKSDRSSTILKVIIFIIFVVLIVGAVLILNNLLGLDLLKF